MNENEAVCEKCGRPEDDHAENCPIACAKRFEEEHGDCDHTDYQEMYLDGD